MPSGYIEISNDSGSTYKKLKVLATEPIVDGARVTPSEIFEAIPDGVTNATHTVSFGVTKKRWRYTCLVKYSSPPSGFATLDELAGYFTGATAASNKLKFRGLRDSTVYDVLIVNKSEFTPKPITFSLYDADAYYTADLELIEI